MPKTAHVQANTISRPNASRRDRRGDCAGQLRVYHPPARIVTVSGDIDASNVGRVSDYISGMITPGGALILDFSRVHFLSVAGFRAIARISEECGKNRMAWVLVSSNAVQLMLRLADPHRNFPAAGSLDEAVQRLKRSTVRSRPSRPVTPAHLTRC